MGEITSLKIQKKNSERVSVFVDGEYAFSVSLLTAAQLHKGQTLTPEEIAELEQGGEAHLAYQQAQRYLSFRPRSRAEVEKYLRGKETDEQAIEEVLSRLESRGYLNDEEFARFWVDDRLRFRPRGERALRFELHQKGLGREEIDAALEGLDEGAAAWDAVAGKLERWRELDEREFLNKVSAYLSRRGFSYDVCRQVGERRGSRCRRRRTEAGHAVLVGRLGGDFHDGLAVSHACDRSHKGVRLRGRQPDVKADIGGVFLGEQFGLEIGERAFERRDRGVVNHHLQFSQRDLLRHRQGSEGGLHAAAVGAHEAAFAQQRAAEVARDDSANVADAAVQQYCEHRASGCAVRFAGIAQANARRAAGRADDIGPAAMAGVGKFGADGGDVSAGGLQRGSAAHCGDKAAAFDLLFHAMHRGGDGIAVGGGGHAGSRAARDRVG